MAITLNGSGTITGVSSLATALVNPVVTTTMGVGNATPAASGAGITFPATQSASTDVNTLDDYEEGTFTPVVSYSGSTSGVTYSGERAGYYTKIGNIINVQLVVALTNKGTGSGSVRISLPFACIASRAGLAIGNTQGISANNSSYQAMIEGGTSYVLLRAPSGLGSTTELGYADINNSFYVVLSGIYNV